jgi:hypothetical protein
MDKDRENQAGNDVEERRQPNVLPATEIAQNPNPRANENIRTETDQNKKQDASGVGSEITDGEDA